MEQKCPHCGSKYVQQGRVEEKFSKKIYNYRCLSCKKDFSVSESKRSAQGTWLMTLYDRELDTDDEYEYADKIEIYRDSSGNIAINQKANRKYISGSVKFRIYESVGAIWIDTNQSSNDPNGAHFIVSYVEMNNALTEKALQHEAMRIAYHVPNRGIFYLTDPPMYFCLTELTDELRTDIAAYLRSVTGASESDEKKGCYVATAVYGSYDCPQVWTLRRFRDDTLAGTWYGRAFIRTYYAISPTLVKWFGHTTWFKNMWRGKLDKMVDALQKQGVESTPYQDKNW